MKIQFTQNCSAPCHGLRTRIFRNFKIVSAYELNFYTPATHSSQMQNDSSISIPGAVALARRDAEAGELFPIAIGRERLQRLQCEGFAQAAVSKLL